MNLDWIAGFFDGEGSVTLQPSRHRGCKYGYLFTPEITISQKSRLILDEIQRLLKIGKVLGERRGRFEIWRLRIRRHQEIRRFIVLFSRRVKMKKEQLSLLREGLDLLGQTPRGGSGLWFGAIPKPDILRLLEIAITIRKLNGKRGKRTNNLEQIQQQITDFDENTYERKLQASWQRRIAPLIEQHRKEMASRPSASVIFDLYWNKRLTLPQVATEVNSTVQRVRRTMTDHSISCRPRGRQSFTECTPDSSVDQSNYLISPGLQCGAKERSGTHT